jgi:hypothetical protein
MKKISAFVTIYQQRNLNLEHAYYQLNCSIHEPARTYLFIQKCLIAYFTFMMSQVAMGSKVATKSCFTVEVPSTFVTNKGLPLMYKSENNN